MAKFLTVGLLVLALAVCVFAADTYYYAHLKGEGSQEGRSGSAFLVVLQGTHNVFGYYLHNSNTTLRASFTIKSENSTRNLNNLVKGFKSGATSTAALKSLGATAFSFNIKKNRPVAEGIWNGSLHLNLTQGNSGFLVGHFESALNIFFANLNGSQNVPPLTNRNTTANGFGFLSVNTQGVGFVPQKKANKQIFGSADVFNNVPNSVAASVEKGDPSVGNVNATTIDTLPPDTQNGTGTARLSRYFGGEFALTRAESTAIQNGKSFLIVSSEKNQGGDVRGQLVPFSKVGALLTGLGGGKVLKGIASPNFGATRFVELASVNFDSQFALVCVPDNSGKFDATFFWKLPQNLEREALGRASFPLISVQGIRIRYNLQIRTTNNVDFAAGNYKLELLPKSPKHEPLTIGTFNGYKRRNENGFQRFLRGYIDIDGTTLSRHLQPNRKLKVRITYNNADKAVLAIDQLAIQVVKGNKQATSYLRSLSLIPNASDLLPK